MKILSVAIPCYNSQDYMEKCIESLLPGGNDVEILVVDDGSHDRTAEIADAYEAKYPGIVKAIHQENGGHGEAVNAGIRNAAGIYFKVVDSDDWVDPKILLEIIETLKELLKGPDTVDMFISNFVYDKVGVRRKKIMQYRSAFPKEEVFTWAQMHPMMKGHYILMHSVIYRTNLLRECGLELPKHTFYVDNLFVFQPFPHVKKMYYLDKVFYHYFIGREDQSVNEEVMIRRIDQQIRVNKIMIDTLSGLKIQEKKLRNYMISYLDIITTISSIMLIRSGTDENLEKKKQLWQYLKQKDRRLYYKLRHGLLGEVMNLPGKGGRQVSVAAYKVTRKFFGFN
ncbi:MAG: glycosyltransferase family A protein [Eubacteriales bacterium]|nr:glycosyltransferase family A protein [Eubacteriales bacterium]